MNLGFVKKIWVFFHAILVIWVFFTDSCDLDGSFLIGRLVDIWRKEESGFGGKRFWVLEERR